MSKYGALCFAATNIGDEIQSIAAQRFLPQVDYWIFREHLNSFSSENHERVKLIMNSWYMWRPRNFPPSNDIEPLLISMCLGDIIRDHFLTAKTAAYLREYGPVGCRDMDGDSQEVCW